MLSQCPDRGLRRFGKRHLADIISTIHLLERQLTNMVILNYVFASAWLILPEGAIGEISVGKMTVGEMTVVEMSVAELSQGPNGHQKLSFSSRRKLF